MKKFTSENFEYICSILNEEGYSQEWIDWFRIWQHHPIGMRIEPSSRCNAKCIHCPRDLIKRPLIEMNHDVYIKIINDLSEAPGMIHYIWHHLNGESLLLDIDELCWRIDYAKDKMTRTDMMMFTNGQLLTPERSRKLLNSKIMRIAVSIDGGNKEDYENIRIGLNFDVVIDNLKSLIALKKEMNSDIKIQTMFLPQQKNKNSIYQYFDLMKKLGVDEPCGTGINNIGGTINAEEMKIQGQYDKGDAHAPCWRVFTEMNIMADGRVASCCQDALGLIIWGDTKIEHTLDIWKGSVVTKLREEFLRRKHPALSSEFDMCNKCDVMKSFQIEDKFSWWNICKKNSKR